MRPPYEKPPHDLRDYLFDELDEQQRAEVEHYLDASPEARDELERLRLTHAALVSVPDEEIPRRVAFVSDKVFEPSRAKRIWREIWAGAPRLAFGTAAVVLAVLVGLSAAQPTLTVDKEGWRIAFGGDSAAAAPPRTASTSLTSQQVRQIVLDVAGAQEDRLREVMMEAVAGHARHEVAVRETAMDELQTGMEQTFHLMRSERGKFYRVTARADGAVLGR
jgi:hypothetical protein